VPTLIASLVASRRAERTDSALCHRLDRYLVGSPTRGRCPKGLRVDQSWPRSGGWWRLLLYDL